MKGIILAGGTGSRLKPLTKVTNKHLLPVGRKPMIYHPIEKLKEMGIEEILIVTGVEHMGDIVSLLGSGAEFGCRFTYKVQDKAGALPRPWVWPKVLSGRTAWLLFWGIIYLKTTLSLLQKGLRKAPRYL